MAKDGKTGFEDFYAYPESKKLIDLVEKDIVNLEKVFSKFTKSVSGFNKTFKKSLDDTSKSIKTNNDAIKKLDKTQVEAVDAIVKYTKANEASNKKAKETSSTIKSIDDVLKSFGTSVDQQKKLVQALTKEFYSLESAAKKDDKALARLSEELVKAKKGINEMSKATRSANNIFTQAEGSANGLKAAIAADVAALDKIPGAAKPATRAYKENEAAIIKLQARIRSNTASLKEYDAQIGRNFRNVGNYTSALGRLGGTARSLGSAFGFVGGVFLFAQGMREAVDTIRTFGKQGAILAGVLNKTRKETTILTEDAKRLGATTARTATEVTDLQIAYARLGFSQSEIVDLTEDTIDGSIALNASLDDTASLVGAMVKTFDDLATTDAKEILDQMTAATQRSALNFERLQTGLPIVAGAANAVGIPFTRLISLMGKLSDAGIDASMSSTALRNIFIESASQGLSYEEILTKIGNSQDKLTVSNDEFGKRAAVSATILSNLTEETNAFAKGLEDVDGVANRVATEQLSTLDGEILLLTSAFEGLVLSVSGAEGALTNVVRFFKDAVIGLQNIDLLTTSLEDLKLDQLIRTIGIASTESGKPVKEFFDVLSDVPYRELTANRDELSSKLVQSFVDEGENAEEAGILVDAYFRNLIRNFNELNDISDTPSKIIDPTFSDDDFSTRVDSMKAFGDALKDNADTTKDYVDTEEDLARLLGAAVSLIDNVSDSTSKKAAKTKEELEEEEKQKKILIALNKKYKAGLDDISSNSSFEFDIKNNDNNGIAGSLKESAIQAANFEAELEKLTALSKEDISSFYEDDADVLREASDEAKKYYKEIQEGEEKRRIATEGAFQAANEISSQYFLNQSINSQNELAEFRAQKSEELKAAKGNQALQNAINNEISQKESQIRKKEYDARKKAALFNIALSLAEKIAGIQAAAALAAGNAYAPLAAAPPVAAAAAGFSFTAVSAQVAVAAGLAAVQAGLVLSEPAPNFEKGTDNAPGGAVIVNDGKRQGGVNRELITTLKGERFFYNTDKPVLTNEIPKGSKIDPRDISELTNISSIAQDYSPTIEQSKSIFSSFEEKSRNFKQIINNVNEIDYDRLGEVIASKMPDVQQIIFEGKGKVRKAVLSGNTVRTTGRIDMLKGSDVELKLNKILGDD